MQLLLVAGASAGCFEQTSCTNCLTTFGRFPGALLLLLMTDSRLPMVPITRPKGRRVQLTPVHRTARQLPHPVLNQLGDRLTDTADVVCTT